MKKLMMLLAVVSLLLAGCGKSTPDTDAEQKLPDNATVETEAEQKEPEVTEQEKQPAFKAYPLPDSTMDNLTDAILAISLQEGDAYVDDTGKMQMDVKIYTYDLYDAVDISRLGVGDIIVTHAGEVEVTALERSEAGYICINGGLDAGGFELASGGGGTFYEIGYDDANNWYEIGEATIRVSADFMGYDNADPEQGEVAIYPGDFLVGAVADYNFTPHNTTVRVEGGQIVEMNRRYVP